MGVTETGSLLDNRLCAVDFIKVALMVNLGEFEDLLVGSIEVALLYYSSCLLISEN